MAQSPIGATMRFFTKEGLPLRYDTKWEDIQDESKKILLSLEQQILEYREESEKLELCADLYKSNIYQENFEQIAAGASQELLGINAAISRNNSSLEALSIIRTILHNTEIAVGSFKRLVLSVSATEQSSSTTDERKGTRKKTSDFYSGLPNKPSPFLQDTVTRFEQQLDEYRQQVRQISQLVCDSREQVESSQTQGSYLDSLHTTMQNLHDFFMHVAAQVEQVHQRVEQMKDVYLANLRLKGINRNPFLEADGREEAKREIEARRVHPTLHTLNPPARDSCGTGPLIISQEIQQNAIVCGSCGSTSSASVGAQPLVSPRSTKQPEGKPVASNQIKTSAPLQIPANNDQDGAEDHAPSVKRAKGKNMRKRG